ncbi:unnamed protein product [Lupinus luteus]|uniref:Uncharacterized protein n=1 Tax=Lupinus luteus TaxID=3873 RepID=A0AAV1XEG8_LUPLU
MAGIRVLDELFKSMQIEKKTIKVKPNWLDHLREKNGIPTGSSPDLGTFLLSEANNTPQLPHFPENTQNLSLRRRPRKQAHPKRRVLGLSHPSTSSTSTTAEGKEQQQQRETVVVAAAADDDVDVVDFVAPADPVAFAAAADPVPLAAPAVPAPLAAHVDLVIPAEGDHHQEGDPQVPVVENPLRPRFRVHVIRPALRQVEEEEEEEEDDLVDEEEEESDITEVEGINHAHLGFQDQSEVESEPSVNGPTVVWTFPLYFMLVLQLSSLI